MKKFVLVSLLSCLLAVVGSQAQSQRPVRAANVVFSQPEHVSRFAARNASKGRRGTLATITLPGRSIEHFWDRTANRWVDGSVSVHTYDSRGNNTQTVYSDSATNALEGRQLITYNARNQETEYTQQSWNGSAYTNEWREQYIYDAQGNITLQLFQQWLNNAWSTQSGYRSTNTYNAGGVLIGMVNEDLNTSTNTWEIEGRIVYTVNANNQWIELTFQEWENGVYVNDERIRNITWHDWTKLLPSYLEDQEWSGGAWVDEQRSTITYQSNGSNVEVQQRSTAPNTWTNDDRITTTYDNFGNLILDQLESWNINAWVVTDAERTLLSYTATNQVRRAVEQDFNIMLNRYVNSSLTTYSNFVTLGTRRATGLEEIASLHPNPSAGVTLLSVPGLSAQGSVPAEVLTMVGQVVQTLTLKPQQGSIRQELNLEGLPAGIYIVRLHPVEGTITKRIVKY